MGAAALVFFSGCAPRKQITERDRKEAAHLVSEAEFASSVREWSRAEGLYAKAVQLVPNGDYWVSLGATRMRLQNRGGAKAAYEAALKAYAHDASRHSTQVEPWLKQAYVLALLGRTNDSRALLVKAGKFFPNDTRLRAFSEPKEFERMISSPKFKEMGL